MSDRPEDYADFTSTESLERYVGLPGGQYARERALAREVLALRARLARCSAEVGITLREERNVAMRERDEARAEIARLRVDVAILAQGDFLHSVNGVPVTGICGACEREGYKRDAKRCGACGVR